MRAPAQHVTFEVTGSHSRVASTFEVIVPPGLDVGAHVHTRSEELFPVLEGEPDVPAFEPRIHTPDNWQIRTPDNWQKRESSSGNRVVRATPGTVVVVPPGCHAFANPTGEPAEMFFQASPPPDHERYFEELPGDPRRGWPPDHEAIEALRAEYDVERLTPLRHRPGPPQPSGPS